MIIPSIDLSEGRVVQWRRGREPVLQRDDAESLARIFGRHSEVAVIDLDAALGRGDNMELVCKLCGLVPCRVGGGIRTVEKGRRLLKAGARRLIIGTQATPEFLAQFPRSMVIASLDELDGEIVDSGWRRKTGIRAVDRLAQLRAHVSEFHFTIVEREGTLAGIDIERCLKFARAAEIPVTVAGGIASVAEVVDLDKQGVDCQVGMALYTDRINLTDAFIACIDFQRGNGLVLAIVRDPAGRVRMKAWMNQEALRATLTTGQFHFWGRHRNAIWRKGESSSRELHVNTVRPDCDRDAILVVADAVGPTCHLDRLSCFGDDEFQVEDLYSVLCARVRNLPGDSGTARLANSPELLREKLLEEVVELLDAGTYDHVAHEAADVFYHLMTLLAARGIPWSRILSELNARRRWDIPI